MNNETKLAIHKKLTKQKNKVCTLPSLLSLSLSLSLYLSFSLSLFSLSLSLSLSLLFSLSLSLSPPLSCRQGQTPGCNFFTLLCFLPDLPGIVCMCVWWQNNEPLHPSLHFLRVLFQLFLAIFYGLIFTATFLDFKVIAHIKKCFFKVLHIIK